MKSMLLGALALMSLSAAAAAESYPECVVGKISAARQTVRCNFQNIQSPVTQANLACRPILIEMLKPGVEMSQVIKSVDDAKLAADAQTTALLNAELKSCGLEGEITVAKGGMQIQVGVIER